MNNFSNSIIRWAMVICLALTFCVIPVTPAQSQTICFSNYTPGATSLSGTVNSYFPGTANATAGATTLSIGAGRGASADIRVGDLLIVMQMQDASIDSRNSNRYGANDRTGSGYTNANNSGRYEYVIARSPVTFSSGGTLTIRGAGTGGGLLYAYTNADASTTAGQRRFQVIRVPAYLNASLGGTLTAKSWNGATGGVLALEVVNELVFNTNAINVNGMGFRGGGGRQLTGGAGDNTDYVTLSTVNTNGAKGEGIAGTPRYVYYGGSLLDTGQPNDGYPNGSNARGAPGTAGGGGTDGEPSTNQQNSGGGGGGNGGAGGLGGNSWSSNLARGGRQGVAFAERAAGRLAPGGGGGAGTSNNGTGTPGVGLASSGGAGGGLILIRARQMSGSGTLTANGASALNVDNDSAGGAGAGGSILMVLNTGNSISGLTVTASGGTGGNAWLSEPAGSTYPGARHGPGGGGGGGVVYLSTTTGVTPSVAGGANGTTTVSNDAYGATAGAAGVTGTTTYASVPGVTPGFLCFSPTAIDLVSMQASAEDSINWAWLALPAVLGMLVITLRKRSGKAK